MEEPSYAKKFQIIVLATYFLQDNVKLGPIPVIMKWLVIT